jgi:hypothetical protein
MKKIRYLFFIIVLSILFLMAISAKPAFKLLESYASPNALPFNYFGEYSKDTTFYLYKANVSLKDQYIITKFFDLNKDKNSFKLSATELKSRSIQVILGFAYGDDKGQDVFIDSQGKIYFVVPKSGIRNKSRLHWLWWKMDRSDQGSLYYSTSPDTEIVNWVNDIRNDIKTAQ